MHGKMIMKAIENAVYEYENLIVDFKELGEKHISKNVIPAYYEVLVESLIITLSQVLQE